MDKLEIYKKGLNLVDKIYLLIKTYPNLAKDFSLCDQLKRAAVSVPTNIAEGYARTNKHFRSYLKIASGSTNELITLLRIVQMIYIIDTTNLQNDYSILGKQIMSLHKSIH